MFLILPSTLLVAALISGPALWHAFVIGDLNTTSAMERFLIAVPVAGLMMAVLRTLTATYRRTPRPIRAQANGDGSDAKAAHPPTAPPNS